MRSIQTSTSASLLDNRRLYREVYFELIIEPPLGFKLSGCKWMYKKERGVDGKVKPYKARLVVKGFTQKD